MLLNYLNRKFYTSITCIVTLLSIVATPYQNCNAVDKNRCDGTTPKICYKYQGSNIGTKVIGYDCCKQSQQCKPGLNGTAPRCLDYCETLGKATCGDPALVTSAQSSLCYNAQTDQCCLEYNTVLQGISGKVAGPNLAYPKCCTNGFGDNSLAEVSILTRASTVSSTSIQCCNMPKGPLPADKLHNPLPITENYYSGLAPASCGQGTTCVVEYSTGLDQYGNFTYKTVCK